MTVNIKYSRKYQLVIQTGLILCSVSDGFIFGQMSGMIDALQGKDDTIIMTPEDISLMAAVVNLSCIGGFMIVGIMTEYFGRRLTISILTLPVAVCWIMIYYACNKFIILLSRIILGVSYGGILVLCHVCVGEYSPSNLRQICFNLMAGVGSLLGSFSGHMLSIFFNWRTVALLGLIPTMLSCILPFFWVESPSWLASKGRFDESRKSFKKLHYMDKENEKELENLIALEKTKVVALKSNSANTPAKTIWRACQQLYLWKIIFLCLMTNVYRVAAGRILFNTMALTIFQDFTGESKLWLVTLLIDGFGILGALLSCVFVSLFRMRSLLFVLGTIGNIVLIILSFVLYYRPDVDGETAWIKACLLALYLIIVNSGPYPVLETILAEVYPLEAKAFCIFIVGSVTGAMQFLAINLAQKMFACIGYHGSFLINSFLTFVSLGYLWVYLPETKGKTLQEIELYFKKGFIDSVELDNSDKDCDFKIMLRDTLKEV
ncbi:probable metabolite transport protein CsbC isoform X2 [Leptidea sinapis]|uniref:probable metabolite transport protein CsbC isoform X2 n=1 Tax=Leptidea sinapis TaxID=189913 RepID=UPI00213366E3|nr:probable metabolite transport protein CsbC isoform X2 [Leptidea sinapis]